MDARRWLLPLFFLVSGAAHAKADKTCSLVPTPEAVNTMTKTIVVPIKSIHLVNDKNEVITLDVKNRDTDILALKGSGRGFSFALPFTDANGLPVASLFLITSVQIETFARGQSEATTASGALCHLKIPHIVDIVLPQPSYVRANELHLLKINMPASELLDFKPTGTPCKAAQLKCDLRPAVNGSITALRDEF